MNILLLNILIHLCVKDPDKWMNTHTRIYIKLSQMYVCIYVCIHLGMYECTYVCIYVWMYLGMYDCTYVCIIHTYICIYVCINTYLSTYKVSLIHVCVCVCVYVHVHVCSCEVFVCVRLYVYVCMYLYIYIYIYMLWSNQNFLSFRRKLRYGRCVHPDVSYS